MQASDDTVDAEEAIDSQDSTAIVETALCEASTTLFILVEMTQIKTGVMRGLPRCPTHLRIRLGITLVFPVDMDQIDSPIGATAPSTGSNIKIGLVSHSNSLEAIHHGSLQARAEFKVVGVGDRGQVTRATRALGDRPDGGKLLSSGREFGEML